jgi:hypothetical protein
MGATLHISADGNVRRSRACFQSDNAYGLTIARQPRGASALQGSGVRSAADASVGLFDDPRALREFPPVKSVSIAWPSMHHARRWTPGGLAGSMLGADIEEGDAGEPLVVELRQGLY